VRAFLAATGLHQSAIPDSTRVFFGYLVGARNYKTFSWQDLQAAAKLPIVNPPLNDVETLASSADDLVLFYARSIQGEFFKNPETLQQYRNVLRLGDVITFVLPLGVTAFAKGGSIDVPGFHALCAPGAMYFNGRWVYFATIINWYAPGETDPETMQRYLVAAQRAFMLLYQGLGGR
jgi:beta-lactamase class A